MCVSGLPTIGGMTALTMALAVALGGPNTGIGGATVSGHLVNRPFKPTQVWLKKLGPNTVSDQSGRVVDKADGYILEFRTGEDFFANETLEVWFSLNSNAKVVPLNLKSASVKFGTDAYRRQHYKRDGSSCVARGVTSVSYGYRKNGESMPDLEMVMDEIGCQLSLKAGPGGSYSGSIDLRLPRHPKVWIKGSFTAYKKS